MFGIPTQQRRPHDSRNMTRVPRAQGRQRPVLEPLEARIVLASVSWINPAGGDWNTAANWSGGLVPNVTQDAVIDIAVSGPITVDSASAVHSLADGTASLDVTGGSLSLASASSIGKDVTLSGSVARLRGRPDDRRHFDRIQPAC